jgi:hypothetical protein
VHLVFDSRVRSGIWGVPTGAFDYELKGAGKVCGLRFRPGAFRALLGGRCTPSPTRCWRCPSVFPWDDAAAQRAVLGLRRRRRHDGRRHPACWRRCCRRPIRRSSASPPSCARSRRRPA